MTRRGRVIAVRLVRWSDRLPPWVSVVAVVVLLVGSWSVVFGAGGTRSAWPHLFYLPVLLAALTFGPVGGLVAGMVATVLCGPLMPLDTVGNESQTLANWAARGVFFTGVGTLAGAAFAALRSTYEQGLADWLQEEVTRATAEPARDTQLRAHLGDVLENRRFHVVFQPMYSLADSRLLAVEALARFDVEPYRPPNLWFGQAHEVGLGVELELAAIDAALACARGHVEPEVAVSINASPATLADARLLEVIDRYGGLQLIVEVTEHAMVDDYQHLDIALDSLRQRGVKLAVDDAGAGFASLRHIVRLAPDFIKLDDSLTQDVWADPIRRALASSLVGFARQTGAQLVAEGIETASDLAAWQALGAHVAQGFYLARPGPLPAETQCPRIPTSAAKAWDAVGHHLSGATAVRP